MSADGQVRPWPAPGAAKQTTNCQATATPNEAQPQGSGTAAGFAASKDDIAEVRSVLAEQRASGKPEIACAVAAVVTCVERALARLFDHAAVTAHARVQAAAVRTCQLARLAGCTEVYIAALVALIGMREGSFAWDGKH
eukprot:4444225-Amphidinium_carterae.1